MEWDSAYKEGTFTLWEAETASPELVSYVATQGSTNNKTALDIGCGAGREAILLAEAGYNVIGVDLSEEAIHIAKERSATQGLNISWRIGNALDLPVESNSVDFINDRGCFHIICEKDRNKYAEEVYRVLKSGGTFLLRGCREKITLPLEANPLANECPFKPITQETIQQHFPTSLYILSPLLPMSLFGNQGHIPAHLIYLTKK